MNETNSYYRQEIESERHQAEIYIETYYNKLLAYEGYKSEVINQMKELPRDCRLLDVGCGTGWFLKLLSELGWSRIEGLDISPDMLEVARHILPGVTFHETPIEKVTEVLEKGGYDVLTCLGTLHHMPDLDVVVSELYSLLKPGGVMLVHEPNEDWFYGRSGVLRFLARLCYAPLRIKNHYAIKDLRAPWQGIPESPHHADVSMDVLRNRLKRAGFIEENIFFKNTLMRIFEGMLFRTKLLDRGTYWLIRKLDQAIVDPLAIHHAGAALMVFKKP